MLYTDADFMRTDAENRRLFLVSEFKVQTGKHVTLDAYTTRQRTNTSAVVISSQSRVAWETDSARSERRLNLRLRYGSARVIRR